jgi:hypothetical protein
MFKAYRGKNRHTEPYDGFDYKYKAAVFSLKSWSAKLATPFRKGGSQSMNKIRTFKDGKQHDLLCEKRYDALY